MRWQSPAEHEAFLLELRRMTEYLAMAAVLERRAERCRPSPGSAVLCACAEQRRQEAARIRGRLAARGVLLKQHIRERGKGRGSGDEQVRDRQAIQSETSLVGAP